MPDDLVSNYVRNGVYLDQQTFPPLRWAVPGLIPEGAGLLVGPPKAGKSWLALDVGLAVAAGGRALSAIDVGPPRPVLMLALEDGERRLQDRSRALLGPRQPIPPRLHYAIRVDLQSVLAVMGDWLDQHLDTQPLIVLDTLGKVQPLAHPGESQYQRDYRIGGWLKQLADKVPGATLLAVHHDRKASSADFIDDVSGTHGLAGSADFVLVLQRPRHGSDALLKVTGRDAPEGEYAITLNGQGRWRLDGATLADAARRAGVTHAQQNLGDRAAEIVSLVGDHPDGVRAADVADALSVPDQQARVYLARLTETGRLTRRGRGLYTLTETQPATPVPPATNVTGVTSPGPGIPVANVTGVTSGPPPPITPVTGVTSGEGEGAPHDVTNNSRNAPTRGSGTPPPHPATPNGQQLDDHPARHPGRCPPCGHHIDTQSHAPTWTTQPPTVAPDDPQPQLDMGQAQP